MLQATLNSFFSAACADGRPKDRVRVNNSSEATSRLEKPRMMHLVQCSTLRCGGSGMTRLMDRRAQDHRIPALDLPGFCPAVCPALAGLPLSDQRRLEIPTGTLEAHSLRALAIRVPPPLVWAARLRLPGKCLAVRRFLIGRRLRRR